MMDLSVSISQNQNYFESFFNFQGLDVPKHGEPAYPYSSYGDGWGEDPPKVNGNGNGIGLSNHGGSYDITVTKN